MEIDNQDFLYMDSFMLSNNLELVAAGVYETCILLVEYIQDEGYVKQMAEYIYNSGCRNILFYGKQAENWHNIFDLVYVNLYELEIEEESCYGAMTVAYDDLVECVDDLFDLLAACEEGGERIGLFYDDLCIYRELADKIKWFKMQPDIFHVVRSYLEEMVACGQMPDVGLNRINLLADQISSRIAPDWTADDISKNLLKVLCSDMEDCKTTEFVAIYAEKIYHWIQNDN